MRGKVNESEWTLLLLKEERLRRQTLERRRRGGYQVGLTRCELTPESIRIFTNHPVCAVLTFERAATPP